MSSNTFKGLTALALSTSMLAISAPAFAQLDEIVTTAQKREQNMQDVPVAITAFDLEALETNRIEGLEDIATFAPGVYVTQNPADPNGVRVNIRGVGAFDPQIGQDSRVAIYQDGVYLGKTLGLALDMPDLAQVDILKGPQGTLYGRNTTAGAVNLISARPDASGFSGKINAEYGNFDHKKLGGALNVPLNETTAVRISGLFLERDGWVENNGPGVNFGGEQKYGYRVAVVSEWAPNFTVDLAYDYNNTEKEPLFYQSVGAGAQPFAAAITPFNTGRQEEVTTSFTNERGSLKTSGITGVATWDVSEGHEVKLTAAQRKIDSSRFVSLIPTADPNILNAITGGFNQALAPLPFAMGATGATLRPDWSTAFDGSTPERGLFLSTPGGQPNLEGHKQTSLELTYNGEFADGRINYTGGVFYFDEFTSTGSVNVNPTSANDYLFVLGAFNPLVTPQATRNFLTGFGVPASAQGPIPGSLALLNFLQVPGPVGQQAFGHLQGLNGINQAFLSAARQSASNTMDIDTESLAIYGQATFNVTDALRVTAGLRFTDEKREGVQQAYSPFFNDTTDLTGNAILPNIGTFEDDKLDPALTIEYDVNDDVLLYGSYKESHRAGGFNASAVGLRLAGETFGRDFKFEREDLTAYEAGFKGDFMDGRARVNAAVYYYDFKNKQTTFALNPLIATERAVVNTDDEIYGFEIDGQFVLADGITARASYSFTDGNPGDTVNPNNPADVRTFDELQGVPKNSWTLALDYNGEMAGHNVFGNITYSHKDDILTIPESNLRLPAIDLVQGRVGVDIEGAGGHNVTLALWVTNLLDEEYLIDTLPFDTFAYTTEVYGQPRSYGVSAGVKF